MAKPKNARLAFVDTETTGLDPKRHEIWEVGLVLRDEEGNEGEYRWFLPVSRLQDADPMALSIGKFHERHPQGYAFKQNHDLVPLPSKFDHGHPDRPATVDLSSFCRQFAKLTYGAHLVGAVISFDEERLRALLHRMGEIPGWHYHLVDVEALAAGKLAKEPPWDSNDLALKVGVVSGDYVRHEALEDARWARDIYDACMNQRIPG